MLNYWFSKNKLKVSELQKFDAELMYKLVFYIILVLGSNNNFKLIWYFIFWLNFKKDVDVCSGDFISERGF